MSWSGSRARNPWATPVGMYDPVVRAELAGLDDRRAPVAVEHRPDVDERDEGATLADDPQVVLAPMEVQAAEDARRPRSTGWPGRSVASRDGSPARRATARGTQPRCRPCRAIAP